MATFIHVSQTSFLSLLVCYTCIYHVVPTITPSQHVTRILSPHHSRALASCTHYFLTPLDNIATPLASLSSYVTHLLYSIKLPLYYCHVIEHVTFIPARFGAHYSYFYSRMYLHHYSPCPSVLLTHQQK